MFCSSCGVDSVEGLRYCKRCGANLTAAFGASPPAKIPVALAVTFLIVIGGVFCVGLGLPMAAAQDMKNTGFSTSEMMILFMAAFGLTLAIAAMLVWLFLRLIKQPYQTDPVRAIELPPGETARPQIAAPPQSVGSVTENTTRTLAQKIYETPRSLR
ncbi:MAG TPA: hypothetical protein VLU47_12030 [Blastocatellia bacterium]|nr:hypothetical protein [Blastocatellia bacterium]